MKRGLTERGAFKILIDHGCDRNMGDIAMVEGVIRQLQKVFPCAKIATIGHPPLSQGIWASYSVAPVEQYAEMAHDFDVLHVAGGGNLTDLFEATVHSRCALIDSFLALGKPIFLSGQQLGPFRNKSVQDKLMQTLKRVTYIGLRDVDSYKLCERSGISKSCFGITGDDSLGVSVATKKRVHALLQEKNLHPETFLAINVRLASYAPAHIQYLDRIAKIYESTSEKLGMPLLFVPISRNPVDCDVQAAQILSQRMRQPFAMLDADLTASEVKGVLSQAYGCVGISWHFCTFALSRGIPAVCLHASDYYAQKGRGLSTFWGDQRLAMPLRDITPDSAAEHIVQTLHDTSLRKHLAETGRSAQKNWQDFFRDTIPTCLRNNTHAFV